MNLHSYRLEGEILKNKDFQTTSIIVIKRLFILGGLKLHAQHPAFQG
jgi:hypothetical protein